MLSVGSLVRASCVALILTAASGTFPAQTPTRTAQTAKSAHTSEGLVFAINSIRVNRAMLFIQYAVQNTTNVRQYIILFGSGQASTENGLFGSFSQLAGISHCLFRAERDDVSLEQCKNGVNNTNGGAANIENYTYIEPGDVAEASITYTFGGNEPALQQAKSASFRLMAFARTASEKQDAFSDQGKTASPPRVVNINFAFVPLQN
jgi:hypothetical protein